MTMFYQPDGLCGAYVFAEDLLDGEPSPDCLAPVHYAVYREIEAMQPGFEPDANDTAVLLTPDDELTIQLRVYGMDSNGDYAYCTVSVLLQDCLVIGNPSVTGVIATAEDETVAGVEVVITGDLVTSDITGAGGEYFIEGIASGSDFSITPYKNDDLMNGVTILDLVLITRHILGIQLLDSPYQLMAADINDNGHITTLDLIYLRRAILQISDTFPNNPSWRFVDAEHTFADPTNPWLEAIPEVISVNNIGINGGQYDFVAVKIGDVNGSAIAN